MILRVLRPLAMTAAETPIPRVRTSASEAASETAFALLDALWSSPVGVAFLDQERRFLQVNDALARIRGVPGERLHGRRVADLFGEAPDVARLDERVGVVLATARPLVDQTVRTPSSKGVREWQVSCYPVLGGSGGARGVCALVHEVTATREAEAFQRHVLGVVGHDLRTPLSSVVMATKLLLDRDDLGDRESKLLSRALAAAQRMDRIIRVLLDYARVRGGQGLPLHRRPTEISSICQAVLDELATLHPQRELVCRGEREGRGDWDPDRVTQAIGNLVGNALDYSPPGTPVEISWGADEAGVHVEIANRGDPIPEDLLQRLFEPFRRGERERPGGRDGLGLGLFIARAIVVAHGGRLECRSSAMEGTRFVVVLPGG